MKFKIVSFITMAMFFCTIPATASVITGESVNISYSGNASSSSIPGSAGIVSGNAFRTTFADVFQQIWTVNSLFSNNQLIVSFSSPSSSANISGGPTLLTLSYAFGAADTNAFAFASFQPSANFSSITSHLSNLSSDGAQHLSLSFSGMFVGDQYIFNNAAAVPEPSPLLLLGIGMVGLMVSRRKSRK